MKITSDHLIDYGHYFIAPKYIKKDLPSWDHVIFIKYLLELSSQFSDEKGWFYRTQKDIIFDIDIEKSKTARVITDFINMDFLEVKKAIPKNGRDYIRHFKINYEILDEWVNDCFQSFIENKPGSKSALPRFSSNSNFCQDQNQHHPGSKSATIKNKEIKNKDSSKEESEAIEKDQSPRPKLKRRKTTNNNSCSTAKKLRSKAKEERKKPVAKAKKKSLFIPKSTLSILEYWNSIDHLPKITIKEAEETTGSRFYAVHTNILATLIKSIKAWFNGDLYLNSSIVFPEGFNKQDRKDISVYNSEEDLLDAIDDWVDILADPIYFPTDNQRKTSLLSFLIGNDRNGAPSAFLNYCVFDRMKRAKPQVEDKFPKVSANIKERWEFMFGKTEEFNEEFIKMANYTMQEYSKDTWNYTSPSGSPFLPHTAAVVRTMSMNMDFIKEKRLDPTILNKDWFREQYQKLIRRRNS